MTPIKPKPRMRCTCSASMDVTVSTTPSGSGAILALQPLRWLCSISCACGQQWRPARRSREHHHSFEPSPPRNPSMCRHEGYPPIGPKRIPAESKATPVGAIFVRPGPPGLGEMEMIASANPKKAIGCSSTECLEPDQSGSTSGFGRCCR
jgi:hypothetical protein